MNIPEIQWQRKTQKNHVQGPVFDLATVIKTVKAASFDMNYSI